MSPFLDPMAKSFSLGSYARADGLCGNPCSAHLIKKAHIQFTFCLNDTRIMSHFNCFIWAHRNPFKASINLSYKSDYYSKKEECFHPGTKIY